MRVTRPDMRSLPSAGSAQPVLRCEYHTIPAGSNKPCATGAAASPPVGRHKAQDVRQSGRALAEPLNWLAEAGVPEPFAGSFNTEIEHQRARLRLRSFGVLSAGIRGAPSMGPTVRDCGVDDQGVRRYLVGTLLSHQRYRRRDNIRGGPDRAVMATQGGGCSGRSCVPTGDGWA